MATPKIRQIVVSKFSTQDSLISLFFHELAHIKMYENGKYNLYHNCPVPQNKKELKRIAGGLVLTIVRAEKSVNNLASKLMRDAFPNRKYRLTLTSSQEKKYINMVSSWYRREKEYFEREAHS